MNAHIIIVFLSVTVLTAEGIRFTWLPFGTFRETTSTSPNSPLTTVDVCKLSPSPGNCRGAIERYYYNVNTKLCETFTYGGCGGNSNNFDTLEKCNTACAPPPVITEKDCKLKKEVGPCEAIIPRFYWDTTTNSCQPFDYGGCQGNINNFETKDSCENACKKFFI